jgi:hypothetical protein
MKIAALTVSLIASCSFAADLTRLESAMGWRDLSGADATSAWRGFKQQGFPTQGWTAKDGVLTHAAKGGGGDIITVGQFGDFDLRLEWRTVPVGNSGVMYRVLETGGATYETGPECQVLDDGGWKVGPEDKTSAGALYDIVSPPKTKKLKPAGEWNDCRVVMRGGVAQHWLNGEKVVELRMFDDAGKPTQQWLDMIAGSKFKAWPGFGLAPKGHIALQDHGDEVSYRNVRIRALDEALAGEIVLFNGKDLTGWEPVAPDLAGKTPGPASVWSVRDGALVCSGSPTGYLRTQADYKNFVLRLRWRFDPAKGAGNSGVLVRTTGEDRVWPRSIEAQLHSGNAGDILSIGGVPISGDVARTNGGLTKKSHGAERPLGEWNEYEIVCNKGEVVLYVNGEEVNRATNAEEVAGKICLQSEGAEIHFKDIRLLPLE